LRWNDSSGKAGASGFVGSHITRLLVHRGRKVRVLLRKTSNGAALTGLDVEIVTGDVLDPPSLCAAMDAGLACGVERFIFTSTMGTLGLNPDGPVTKDIAFIWRLQLSRPRAAL
jgi:dihydroflavonol-4-reductase